MFFDFISLLSNLLLPSSLITSPPKLEEVQIPKWTVEGPFTDHFSQWLFDNHYGVYDFASKRLGNSASFGGKKSERHAVKRRPVLFIHGNSDGALAEGTEEWSQGWTASIQHLLSEGYSSAELYAITYGDRNLANSLQRTVDCQTLLRLRHFMEAVLAYTGAKQMDIVAHSMGVTLARHIIQGHSFENLGQLREAKGEANPLDQCFLGLPLHHKVHTFVGIAGANYGLCLCDSKLAETAPACSRLTGFWTGAGCPEAPMEECHLAQPLPERAHCHDNGQYAIALHRLNAPQRPKDAKFVASIWSSGDSLLGPSNYAWGRRTSLIPNSDYTVEYENHSHHSLKWMTVQDQLRLLAQDQKHLFTRKIESIPTNWKSNP